MSGPVPRQPEPTFAGYGGEQDALAASLEPAALFDTLAGWTVPVTTRVVDRHRVATMVAGILVPAQRRGATALDRA